MRATNVVLAGFMLAGATLGAKPTFMAPAKAARADLVKDCKGCHEAMPATGKNLNAVGAWLTGKFGVGKVKPEDMKALKDYKGK